MDDAAKKRGVKRPLEAESIIIAGTMCVKRGDIPEYLRTGAFFLSLRDDDNEEFAVPSDAMKTSATVSDSADLFHLLKSLRFWGVDGVSPEVVDFVLINPDTNLHSSLESFEQDYPYIHALRSIMLENLSHDDLFALTVQRGDFELVKYFVTKTLVQKGQEYITLAARNRHLHCLRFLHEHTFPWGSDVLSSAVFGGCIDCVKYIHQHHPNFAELATTSRFNPITKDTLDCFIYCYKNGGAISSSIFESAFFCDGLDSVKHCVEEGVVPHELVMGKAVCRNRLDIVQYLHAHNCPWNERACAKAASNGNLSMLTFLHEHGCPWNENTTYYAAQCNKLDCLQYAHEQGCAWDHRAYSVSNLDSACNKYLAKHGCPHWIS